jgi:hypothetical protein
MKAWIIAVAGLLVAYGPHLKSSNDGQMVNAARAAHKEVHSEWVKSDDPVPTPPTGVLDIVHSPTPLGDVSSPSHSRAHERGMYQRKPALLRCANGRFGVPSTAG